MAYSSTTSPMHGNGDVENQQGLHTDSQEKEKSNVMIFTMLATVGTFGSSRALAGFYSARQLHDDPFSPTLLAWAYSAFAIANITALVWLVAFLYRSWMGSRRQAVFWSDFGVLTGGGISILCIIIGTLLISLALAQPSMGLATVAESAYTTLAVVSVMIIIAAMRFAYVTIRAEDLCSAGTKHDISARVDVRSSTVVNAPRKEEIEHAPGGVEPNLSAPVNSCANSFDAQNIRLMDNIVVDV